MMKINSHKILRNPVFPLSLLLLLAMAACTGPKTEVPNPKAPKSYVVHPEWSRLATIYEVNVRQYTPEGTFNAFAEQLPRLKKMGVDILWIMPINPIGEKERKGGLGSYYSVKDYKAVNPEFGTLEDFKSLVGKIHKEGMKVIIDWVANHTAWDNAWVTEHPDWYVTDSLGKMVAPFDWTDVAKLNYGNNDLRAAMLDAMEYWVRDADIDGYRCDVAAEVPVDFWDTARVALDRIKPVFMLAEAETPDLQIRAFDMTYSWDLFHIMNSIAQGNKNANAIQAYYEGQDTLYPRDAYRMLFTSNHDENSWSGTEFERMGEGSVCMAVLTATLPGMPLVYSGQESAFNRRLRFFDKDTIDWDDYRLAPFYTKLFNLKHAYQPLWNGDWGARLERIKTTADTSVFAFIREKEGDRVFVIANLSGAVKECVMVGRSFTGKYTEWFSEQETKFGKDAEIRLKPWEYKVYVKK